MISGIAARSSAFSHGDGEIGEQSKAWAHALPLADVFVVENYFPATLIRGRSIARPRALRGPIANESGRPWWASRCTSSKSAVPAAVN